MACLSSLDSVSLSQLQDRDIIERSVLLKNMIDDLGEGATVEAIPISNVSSALLPWINLEIDTHQDQ